MPIAVNDVIRMAFQWFVDGVNEQVNVHHMQVNSVGGLSSDVTILDAAIAAILANLYTPLITAFANNLVGQVVNNFNVTQDVVLPDRSFTFVGTGSGSDALSRQVTALLCFNGDQPRRQGRTYLPSMIEGSALDTGLWDSGLVTSMLLSVASMILPISNSGATFEKVVCKPDGSDRMYPSSGIVPTAPRTQRRRTPGRGS